MCNLDLFLKVNLFVSSYLNQFNLSMMSCHRYGDLDMAIHVHNYLNLRFEILLPLFAQVNLISILMNLTL